MPQQPHNRVDLLRTLPEGELKEKLSEFSGDRINLDRFNRDDLVKIILELQKEALTTIDPELDPARESNESNFYDYWDDWNINNWGDFFDHDFANI